MARLGEKLHIYIYYTYMRMSLMSLNSLICFADDLKTPIKTNCIEFIKEEVPCADNPCYEDNDSDDSDASSSSSARDVTDVTFGRKGRAVGEFQNATGITYVDGCHILVADMVNGRIQKCTSSGKILVVYGGAEIREPWCTCLTSDGDIALTCRRRKNVLVVSADGEIKWSFGTGFFQAPSGICTDAVGNFIVTDAGANRVSIHDKRGTFIKYIGNAQIKEQAFSSPRYVCVSHNGDVIVSDSGNHAVKMFDKNGHFIRSIGSFGKGDGQLKTPYGVCTDALGHVLVADHYNNRVCMFTHEGQFVCHVVGEKHGVVHPKALALDAKLNLYVSTGHLKACTINVFKLTFKNMDIVVHV